MRRRRPRQVPIPFEPEVPAVVLPAPIAQDLVKALADLLLASAGDPEHPGQTVARLRAGAAAAPAAAGASLRQRRHAYR
jgi:hypothetical protein